MGVELGGCYFVRMQSGPVCPRCGCLAPNGVCPICGATPRAGGFGRSRGGSWFEGRRPVWPAVIVSVLISVLLDGLTEYGLARHRAHVREAELAALFHAGPVANREELKGTGRIYLVPLEAHTAAYSVEDFAEWLRAKYDLDVQVLPPLAVDRAAWDGGRRQWVAELLYAQMKRQHADLAADPNAYLIGFTDESMYSVNNGWKFSLTQRDMQRAAVISAHEMQDGWLYRIRNAGLAREHLETRLRRILLKDVAILYWHLPLNNDPTSLLHDTLDPDIPAEDIFESDLQPERGRWGQSEGEPCVFFSYTATEGIKPLPGNLIRSCADKDLPHEQGRELFELDLQYGLLIDKRTDFLLPDVVPIAFERATQQGWSGANPFGTSGTDNYDQYLASDDNVTIRVIHDDGGRDELVRRPRWLPILPLVKYVDSGSGRFYEMRWYTRPFEHYDVRRYDGEVQTYLPCDNRVYCYLVGYRDAQGRALTFERDGLRRLVRLASPNGNWLRFMYGPADHIAEIVDSRGRDVRYGYDLRNRLISVSYPSGEVFHYEYDDEQHLLGVSVSADSNSAPEVLLRNEYIEGRVRRQTLANGEVYSYSYYPNANGQVQVAMVHAPGGKMLRADMTANGSIVRERDAAHLSAIDSSASH